VKSRDEFVGRGVTGQGGYTNYLDEESRAAGVAWLQRRFGSNYARLIEVKQKYDPIGLFGRVSLDEYVGGTLGNPSM
jgi:hypothetical protein